MWRDSPTRARAASLLRLTDHTKLHISTVSRTPIDEGSARRRDLYLAKHNTRKRQASLPLAGFEPAFPASDRKQALAFDRWDRQFVIVKGKVFPLQAFGTRTVKASGFSRFSAL